MMFHIRAMLTAPLMAMAVVVSSPVGAFAAVLAPFPPRGSGLLVRQNGEVKIPQQCNPTCDPAINTINVSTLPPFSRSNTICAGGYLYTDSSQLEFVGLPHGSMRLYESEHERLTRLHGVCRFGVS